MSPPTHPESYHTLSLPQIRLSHNPPSSPTATPVVLVILDRPEAKNAFTETMADSLVTAFNLLSTDPRVRAVVLTGSDASNRTFCAGMDLSSLTSSSPTPPSSSEAAATTTGSYTIQSAPWQQQSRQTYRDSGGRVALAIHNCAKPVVVGLNGSAVGVGITMTLAANIRVASSAAKIGFVFARRGIAMEACSSFFLPRLVGGAKALHLVTVGGVYAATDPLVRDLFGEVVPPAEVVRRAVEIAEEVAGSCSAVSVRVMRDMVLRGADTPEGAHALESKVLYDLFRGRDFVEGVKSFKEKRLPRFEGNLDEDAPRVWPWWEWKEVKEVAKI
ncbi:putative enoyl-CoA hydratase/isomerase [Coniochaeta ligniaria NRRL 30616]|uniref:Putative enoyl-CoA hydratase/isomerase n=1 Tax=Coniochaeta ligniaria NRRL 30616 TaxID=1408157 RepID=A0A1J7JF11_9PEZI|nr:putative enoyl-CoA hydratase/isomerase [Coniochaeta ligniaria NRRL 30616]